MRVHPVVVLLAAALGGCSVVGSNEPLFKPADSVGAPVLRPGLWALPNADCKYDEASPATGWPECANATVVTPERLAGGEAGPSGKGKQSLTYRLAAGDPPVLQLSAPEDEKDGPRFLYAGLRSTKVDDQGRTVEARVWLALCTKPPKFDSADITDLSKSAPKKADLPKGLEPAEKGSCIARKADAARAAVKRSEGWIASGGDDDFSIKARWVRDGDK